MERRNVNYSNDVNEGLSINDITLGGEWVVGQTKHDWERSVSVKKLLKVIAGRRGSAKT